MTGAMPSVSDNFIDSTIACGWKMMLIALSGGFGGLVNALSLLIAGGKIKAEKPTPSSGQMEISGSTTRTRETGAPPVFGGKTKADVRAVGSGQTANAVGAGDTRDTGEPVWKATLGVPLETYIEWQAVIGVGGAFAAVFGLLTIGNATKSAASKDFTDEPIYLAALCVVGGFLGNKLLVAVGAAFQERLNALSKKVEENRKEVKAVEHSTKELKKEVANQKVESEQKTIRTSNMSQDLQESKEVVDRLEGLRRSGYFGLTPEIVSRAGELLDRLEDYRKDYPVERVVNIVSANLQFELGLTGQAPGASAETAISRLEEFILDRRSAGLVEDETDEVAWFNLACYQVVLSLMSRKPQRETARNDALKELEASLQIAANSGRDRLLKRLRKLQVDNDLGPVLNQGPFSDLIRRFQDQIN